MKLLKKNYAAIIVLLAILAVSAYDAFQVVAWQEYLKTNEANPLARWLIEFDRGRMALLIGCKTFGTGLVTMAVAYMIHKNHKALWPSLWVMLLVQMFVVFRWVDGRF